MAFVPPMPPRVGVRLAHAVVQTIADREGIDVLHVKGPAVNSALLLAEPESRSHARVDEPARRERQSGDADILVRPEQVEDLIEAMKRHDWSLEVDFADGSTFRHAATLSHTWLAPVDVHRYFPGFAGDPAHVFERMWASRGSQAIAGRPCSVPSVTAQRLLLILNAVRAGPLGRAEIDRLWWRADASERLAVETLAHQASAEVALAAATGNLDDFIKDRQYDLWAALSAGDASRAVLWRARVKAQPNWRASLAEGVRLLVPNARRVAFRLGRQPTKRELLSALVSRLVTGARELLEVALTRVRMR